MIKSLITVVDPGSFFFLSIILPFPAALEDFIIHLVQYYLNSVMICD